MDLKKNYHLTILKLQLNNNQKKFSVKRIELIKKKEKKRYKCVMLVFNFYLKNLFFSFTLCHFL